jgi:hypothetical protein
MKNTIGMNQTRRKKIKKAAKTIIRKTAKEIAEHQATVLKDRISKLSPAAQAALDRFMSRIPFDGIVPLTSRDPGKLGERINFVKDTADLIVEKLKHSKLTPEAEADVAASFNNIEEGEIVDQDPDHDFDVNWGRCTGKAEGLELGIELMERMASSFFLHEETEAAEAARQNYKILQEEWAKQQLRLHQFEWQQQNVKQGERKTP